MAISLVCVHLMTQLFYRPKHIIESIVTISHNFSDDEFDDGSVNFTKFARCATWYYTSEW